MWNGEYSVDWGKVQSKEYRRRLSSLSEDERVISSIETRAKWALNNRDGLKTEELYAIDLSSGDEISKIIDQQLEFGVERTSKFNKKLDIAESEGKQILLIHNHPRGLPPGIGDVNALIRNKSISGITVGHDGSIYYYTRPNDTIPKDEWTVALKHFNKFQETTAEEKAMELLSKKYGFIFKKL